jgi:hypothetical protein
VCKGVSEATVANAASTLAKEVEHALKEEASTSRGADVPFAPLDLRLTAFDANAIHNAVGDQVRGFTNGGTAESKLRSALQAFVTSLGAEMKSLSLTASARGARAAAPLAAPTVAASSGGDGGGLEELSSAVFTYTWNDSWANDAPDSKVRANQLLNDPSFRNCFRTGANDYAKVANHVANALSKTKQRLEIRVYHHPEKRAVGEARAATLKRLWEFEQNLKGGGQEETFSKRAWLKTVKISIRYIPRTNPTDRNIITFAVGGDVPAKPAAAKPAPESGAITWEASSFVLRAEWACCTDGVHSGGTGSAVGGHPPRR